MRIFATYVSTHLNYFADALSQNQMSRFWKLAKEHRKMFDELPCKLPNALWPIRNDVSSFL